MDWTKWITTLRDGYKLQPTKIRNSKRLREHDLDKVINQPTCNGKCLRLLVSKTFENLWRGKKLCNGKCLRFLVSKTLENL